MADVEDVSRTAGRAVEHVVDPPLQLARRREERGGVEVALDGPPEAESRPRLVERELPVEPDDVAATGSRLREVGAYPEREFLTTGTPAEETISKSARLYGATLRR